MYSYPGLRVVSPQVCLPLQAASWAAEPADDCLDDPEEGLGAWHHAEGGGEGPSIVKVGQPQFRPRKLPLHISIILREGNDYIIIDWKHSHLKSKLLIFPY